MRLLPINANDQSGNDNTFVPALEQDSTSLKGLHSPTGFTQVSSSRTILNKQTAVPILADRSKIRQQLLVAEHMDVSVGVEKDR